MNIWKAQASKATVMDTSQVAVPNDEFWPRDMSKAVDLNMRKMQTSLDMSIKPARGK